MRVFDASRSRTGLGWAVARYALSGFAALVLLGGVGVYLLERIGHSEAIRHAKQLAALAGHGVAEQHLTPALERGDPAAIRDMDGAVRRIIVGGNVVRVKIWLPDGRIVYSDQHELIGSRYQLGADDLAAVRSGKVEADISDLRRPENRFERRFGKLLEVYLPIRDTTGRKLLYEQYERYSSVASSGRRLWLSFAPAILGALALLWLIQLPLAWRAARRLQRGQADRERLLRRAIEASEAERRRIAHDLHDGAVQDLAGVSYSLAATAEAAPPGVAAVMEEAAEGTRRTIKELRTLLVDIYPPDLHRSGLDAALRDLTAPLAPHGIETKLEIPAELDLPDEVETLFYRCAQEALRNVVKHAHAQNVLVRVENDGRVCLTVEDDGVGLPADAHAEGHFGMRLLGDLAREAGGDLHVESEPGSGTRVTIEVPR
ncbi:MAG TPA: sensor histidine kinase [Gaiellaceae bacterium]|nr:sensor histidine kinase [Gaiellaceae bacterium]